MSKPLIVVSNDDGISSVGIRVLVELMSEIGEVIVVAPDSPQSGMGHAITVGNTLRLDKSNMKELLKTEFGKAIGKILTVLKHKRSVTECYVGWMLIWTME